MKTTRSRIVVLFILFVLLISSAVLTHTIYNNSKNLAVSNADERSLRTIEVKANRGKFEPSNIETELFGDVDMVVTSEDADYQFKINGYPRFDTEIKRGETKKIQLYSLGVGEYEYECGKGCSGKIVVKQQTDADEDM